MKQRIQSQELLFYLAYGLFVTMTLLRTTFFYQYIEGLVLKVCLGLCVFIIALKEYFWGRGTRRMITALIIGFGYISLAVFVQVSQYLVLAATVIFVFAAREIPFRRIAGFSAIILFAVLTIVIICSQVGIIMDFILDDGYGRIRHYLGFRYALYPSTVVMNITMLAVYVRKRAILWIELIILAGINAWIFIMTGSRLAFILALVVIAIGAFLKIWPEFLVKKKKFKYCLTICFIVLALGSLYVSTKYDPTNATQKKINSVLSNRLKHQKKAMDDYGFSLFGNDIEMYGNGLNSEGELGYDPDQVDYFYIDNNYVAWYVCNGFVFFVLMIILCTLMTVRSIKYDRYGYLLLILVLMSVFCVIQDTFLSLHYNTFLLAAGNLIMNNKTETQLEEEQRVNPLFSFIRHRILKEKVCKREKLRHGVRWS